MLVLGVSGHFSGEDTDLAPDMSQGFFHDAAACLIRDGQLIAAAEEERFNRIKKTTKFPVNAIRACLATAGVSPGQIDAAGHYFAEYAVDMALSNLAVRNPAMALHRGRDLMNGYLRGDLGIDLPDDRLIFAEHHLSHAMSSFLRSGLKEALVAVMDSRGEGHAITIYHGVNGRLERLTAYGLNKSLGAFYENNIRLLGYRLGDEYKVMGLAPYGNPETYQDLFSSMYTLKDGGDFELRTDESRSFMIFAEGFQPRRKDQEFTRPHMDFAAGLQQSLERIAMHVLGYWAEHTGLANLCFVGGVAHNSTLNGLIIRSGRFDEVFIHPVSHDAGAAEGAALAAADRLGAPPYRQPRMRSASVGPDLGTPAEIEKQLAAWADLIEYEQPADIVDTAAGLLAGGCVLAWAHGQSEFGPRALGNRSILADARPAENKQRINSMVKKRESYRPFAPVVTPEAAADYFDLPETRANYDFMSFVVDVREDRRKELGAVTHIDGSARIQIIEPATNERYYRLVQRFGELTGTPVLLNTSFNNNAEPIVQDVHDALTCFLTTELDVLVIEDFLIRRRPGPLRFDGLVLRFRPVTRIARLVRTTQGGAAQVRHEIYLDYTGGTRAAISPEAFDLLAAADGLRTVASLAASAGGLSDDIRTELYALWQGRYFVLRPADCMFMS